MDTVIAEGRDDRPLSAETLDALQRDGFVAVSEPVVEPQEREIVRAALRRILDSGAGFAEGAQFNMVVEEGSDEPRGLPQVLDPSSFAPELRRLHYRAKALSIARQILGPDAQFAYEHAIVKPARHGLATPWHQDEAFRTDPEMEYRQVSIWTALDDVDADGGCMHYVPGSHHVMRPHRHAGGDPQSHALECVEGFDPAAAVACPLPAGALAIHVGRSLHCAGANRSARDRYAYILGFEAPPRRRIQGEPRTLLPLATTCSADRRRRRRWLWRGGALVLIARKLRQGTLKDSRKLRALRGRIRQLFRA